MDPTETLNTKVADPNCLQHLTDPQEAAHRADTASPGCTHHTGLGV